MGRTAVCGLHWNAHILAPQPRTGPYSPAGVVLGLGPLSGPLRPFLALLRYLRPAPIAKIILIAVQPSHDGVHLGGQFRGVGVMQELK